MNQSLTNPSSPRPGTPGRGAGGEGPDRGSGGNFMEPIEFARFQRRTARSYEQLLWQFLRNRQRCGKKFRRQHTLGRYTADFYCAEAKLVVEVDGSPHQTAEGQQTDAARDAWMRLQGIEVLRFGGWQVEFEARHVIDCIDKTLRQRCAQ